MSHTTTIYCNDAMVDGSLVALPMQVTHGRSGTDVQPDSPVLEFEYLGSVPPCVVGDRIKVISDLPPTEPVVYAAARAWSDAGAMWGDALSTWLGENVPTSTRFVGVADEVRSVEVDGEVVSWEVRCIGAMARLGYVQVREERPIETDIQRVQAIAAKAGISINISGTSSMTLAADEMDRSALDALHEVCKSTGGLLWQDRGGEIWYGTASHRDVATSYVLPAGAILDGLDWTKSADPIINSVTIVYPRPDLPPAPSQGEWDWSTSLNTGVDPGPGKLVANDINSTQVSTIALSATALSGTDATLGITRRLAGDRLYIQERLDSSRWARFTLTGPPVDNGDWFTISVDFKEHGEVGEIVANNQDVIVTFDSRLEGGDTQETFTDDASIAQWGLRHVEIQTLCSDADAASLLALTILARRAQPFWSMPGVLVPLADVSAPDYVVMQALDVSMGILAPLPESPSPTPGPVVQWAVEGFVEEWRDTGEQWMQLSLSPWSRSSSASVRTWQELADTHTYAQAVAKTYRQVLVEV